MPMRALADEGGSSGMQNRLGGHLQQLIPVHQYYNNLQQVSPIPSKDSVSCAMTRPRCRLFVEISSFLGIHPSTGTAPGCPIMALVPGAADAVDDDTGNGYAGIECQKTLYKCMDASRHTLCIDNKNNRRIQGSGQYERYLQDRPRQHHHITPSHLQ